MGSFVGSHDILCEQIQGLKSQPCILILEVGARKFHQGCVLRTVSGLQGGPMRAPNIEWKHLMGGSRRVVSSLYLLGELLEGDAYVLQLKPFLNYPLHQKAYR